MISKPSDGVRIRETPEMDVSRAVYYRSIFYFFVTLFHFRVTASLQSRKEPDLLSGLTGAKIIKLVKSSMLKKSEKKI